jgi:hypothetical protein
MLLLYFLVPLGFEFKASNPRARQEFYHLSHPTSPYPLDFLFMQLAPYGGVCPNFFGGGHTVG